MLLGRGLQPADTTKQHRHSVRKLQSQTETARRPDGVPSTSPCGFGEAEWLRSQLMADNDLIAWPVGRPPHLESELHPPVKKSEQPVSSTVDVNQSPRSNLSCLSPLGRIHRCRQTHQHHIVDAVELPLQQANQKHAAALARDATATHEARLSTMS